MSPQHLTTAAPSNRMVSLSPSELTLLLLLRSSPITPSALALILCASTLALMASFWVTTLAAAATVDIVLKSARCRGETKFSGSILPWNRGERFDFFNALMARLRGNAVSTVILLPSRIVSSINFPIPGLIRYEIRSKSALKIANRALEYPFVSHSSERRHRQQSVSHCICYAQHHHGAVEEEGGGSNWCT